MGVKFYADNWLTSAAGVGLFKVLENAQIDWKPLINGNSITLPNYIFEKLADLYAEYLLSDFDTDRLADMLENNKLNVYNNIVFQKIGDFYSNSPLTNPSSTRRANEDFKGFYEGEANIEILYNYAEEVVNKFISEQFKEILNYPREGKLCFFCREREAYLKKGKIKVFDATNFTPLAASPDTLENFFWEGESNMYLCPECEIFLYFSAFAFHRTPRGTYLFVYTPDLEHAYDLNNLLSTEGSISIISRTIVEAAKRTEGRKAEWVLKNIYLVEIEKVGDAQANIYTLNIPNRLARAIRELIDAYPDNFKDIFDLFIERIYSGNSLYEFVYEMLSGFFHGRRYKDLKGRRATLLRKGKSFKDFIPHSLTYFIKFQEVLDMEDREKVSRQVGWAYSEGRGLKEAYLNSFDDRKRAEKKIEGISYRILDAIRRRDTDAFQQNLIRAYLEVEREIPYIFVEALKEGSFNRVAYAFLIGLNGKVEGVSETDTSES
ncbi:type I-B CRISPR-associated protein Cas8b1/Cst1 [Hydrogenivirga sp.]